MNKIVCLLVGAAGAFISNAAASSSFMVVENQITDEPLAAVVEETIDILGRMLYTPTPIRVSIDYRDPGDERWIGLGAGYHTDS